MDEEELNNDEEFEETLYDDEEYLDEEENDYNGEEELAEDENEQNYHAQKNRRRENNEESQSKSPLKRSNNRNNTKEQAQEPHNNFGNKLKNLNNKFSQTNQTKEGSGGLPKAPSLTPSNLPKIGSNGIKTPLNKGAAGIKDAVSNKVALSGKKALIKFFSSPHGMIVLGMIAVAALLFLLMIMFFGGKSSSDNHVGLYGYDYYEACTDVQKDGEKMSMEEYVARVVAAEVGGFPMETQKTIAIAARTFVIANGKKMGDDESCYYVADGVKHAYSKSISDNNVLAANETRGLIITVDDKPKSHYDASCVYSASDALALDAGGNYSNNNYYIKYGEWDIGGVHFQKIEPDKLPTDIPGFTLDYYIEMSESNGPCYGNHGGGISQNGAAYLEVNENYTWEDIINYYYDGQATIKSIYQSFEATSNWTQVISSSGSSSSLPIDGLLNTSIRSLMSSNEYNELNELLRDTVVNVGVGTRDAIVNAAVLPIQYLAEHYRFVYPYTYGGGHGGTKTSASGENVEKASGTYYGINPDWGTLLNNNHNYGPDCSAWLVWVYKNAGLNNYNFSTIYGESQSEMSANNIAKVGDILYRPSFDTPNGHVDGHVMIVVGIDEEKGVYYISHASSTKTGVVITTTKMDGSQCAKTQDGVTSKCRIVDMTNFIENNKNANYETEFNEGVIAY